MYFFKVDFDLKSVKTFNNMCGIVGIFDPSK